MRCAASGREELHQRTRNSGFTTTALAYQPECFSFSNFKSHAIHRFHHIMLSPDGADGEMNLEIFDTK